MISNMKMINKISIALLLFLGYTKAASNTPFNSLIHSRGNNSNSTLKWPVIQEMFQKALDETLSMSTLMEINRMLEELHLSSDCTESLVKIMFGLRKTKRWAIHMVDSSGKLPSGILEGTVMDFGSYDECLKIRFNDSSLSFRGQYCMVGYSSPLISPFSPNSSSGKKYIDSYGYPPEWIAKEIINAGGYLKRVAFWLGTCVPSTCSQEDMTKLLSQVTKPLGMKVSIADCQIEKPNPWPYSAFVAVCFMMVIAGLCFLGTTADIITIRQHSYCHLVRFLKAFSIYTNTEKLMSNIPDGGALGCFHGMRFLSSTWIVLGHTYFFTDTWKYLKYRNLLGFQAIFNHNLPLAIIENFTIPVGSFFFMSGFLLVYSTWRKLERNNGKLNLIMFFIHKYWRMTPALVLMILMLMALPLINAGPLWNSTLNPPIQACEKHWWTNILYINNWWGAEDFCVIHTWYLAALMQFHLVGVIVLLICYRWRIIGTILGLVIAIGSCILTSFIAAWNDYPMPAPGYIKDMDIVDDYNTKIYVKSFNHTVTYFMGMLTAYLVLKYKDKRMATRYQILGWVLALTSSLCSIYGLYGPADSIVVRSFYIGFHRIGWTFGVCWVAYSCITGNGGIINRFLSWKPFIPLGHLSYLVYLIHPLVILYRTASLRERVYYGHTDLVFEYLAYTLVSFFLAFIGYITVEMPFTNLEGMIFKTSSSVKPNPDDSNQKEISPPHVKNIP
ncbi:nose resistant to fluoxetine protein 6 [Parasteatoda tepidariorum]|uniref:nose resistant to fluoxetine protein 6 n=1 Tax=Parasteatoda tepidariorum TaxID=114398 RepID=UPI001C722405|nr:nose resistant to fluoxetine protein 6 [Parasteatoda tepidariorum]